MKTYSLLVLCIMVLCPVVAEAAGQTTEYQRQLEREREAARQEQLRKALEEQEAEWEAYHGAPTSSYEN